MRWPRKKDFKVNPVTGFRADNQAHSQMQPAVGRKSPTESETLVEEQQPFEVKSPLSRLTPRERDVFELLIKGRKLQEAADELGVKYSTANTHQKSVYKKLGVNSRAECILRYGKPGEG